MAEILEDTVFDTCSLLVLLMLFSKTTQVSTDDCLAEAKGNYFTHCLGWQAVHFGAGLS